MRINRYVAQSTGMSRRAADLAIADGRVCVNHQVATPGVSVDPQDTITLDSKRITPAVKTTILLHKPVGFVCSREGQGSQTIYDLLPKSLHHLKPIGRLDKDSSGLLLLTNDGQLAHDLMHPSKQKGKLYEVTLDKPLHKQDEQRITSMGVDIGDSQLSKFGVERLVARHSYLVTLKEGRNRQIRRTFQALGYTVVQLHRTTFGDYTLDAVQPGKYKTIDG